MARTAKSGRIGKVPGMSIHDPQPQPLCRDADGRQDSLSWTKGAANTFRSSKVITATGVVMTPRNVEPEMLRILEAVEITAPETRDGVIWITSAYRTSSGSKHRTGEAFDIRIKNVKGFDLETFAYNTIIQNWADRLSKSLGPNYDVVYETNHLHVEYDPK